MQTEKEIKTLSDTICKLEARKILNRLGDRLDEIQVDKTH